MTSPMPGINSLPQDPLNIVLCNFAANHRCVTVCTRWREIIQQHFCSLASSHLESASMRPFMRSFMTPFIREALNRELPLRPAFMSTQNQEATAFVKNTVLSVRDILRSDLNPAQRGPFVFSHTSTIETLMQSNKDRNLKSFYAFLKPKIENITGIEIPNFTEAEEIRKWMSTNPASLTQIRTLEEFDRTITEIPEEINLLTGLEQLNLRDFRVLALPNELNLPNLIQLVLNNTWTSPLPDRLNLPNLRSLYLINSSILALPNGLSLPSLRNLYLQRTNISSLPNDLNLPMLEHLNLAGARIAALPNGLSLPNLGFLDLSNTRISALPEGLNLPNVFWLDLSNTPISALPEGLNLPSLLRMDLSNTPISALPNVFNLPNLKVLNLSNTLIAVEPDTRNLPNLVQLDFNTPLRLMEEEKKT